MGVNCVAGTTEYIEDEGIGLVLYTNSESNLIVWKMSDGTKQGTTVPLTTEYRSMLKSEFENKTGITIENIIIHPYTEETIDIESSITINSGDTPEETLMAISFSGANNLCAGHYIDVEGKKQLNLYMSDATSHLFVITSNGTVVSNNGPFLDDSFASYIKGKLSSASIPIDEVKTESKDFTINESVPNWENYQIIL